MSSMKRAAEKCKDDSIAFRRDDRTDLYFLNTRTVLEAEGFDPVVGVEVFSGRDGVLCGIDEAVGHLGDLVEAGAEIQSLSEGDSVSGKEVVLTVRCRYRSIGTYETALLGTLSQTSGWATAAAACVRAAGPVPVICFGARHVHPAVSDRMEYAALVGGCVGCATQAGAALAGMEATGTMPHALILVVGDTLNAAEAFDRHMPESVRRVVLVDTFIDEVEEAARLAQAMGDRLWGVRLDTPSELGGVTPELVRQVRARLDASGGKHSRILVSGGLDVNRIREFVETNCGVDGFGVGSAITSASPIDFTMDIKEVEGRPTAKRGRVPGMRENARLKKVR